MRCSRCSIAASHRTIRPIPHLALAGGCAFNSVANGKIRDRTPFEASICSRPPGDAGGAIGAALAVWHSPAERRAQRAIDRPPTWGPSLPARPRSRSCCESRRSELEQRDGIVLRDFNDDLPRWSTGPPRSAIADGKVIGWFQGRMEWGPRALGNRSILGDPRRTDMKDILNIKIKRRERRSGRSRRRCCASASRTGFELDDDVPFMLQVFAIREDKRPDSGGDPCQTAPAACRPSTAAPIPRYYALISAFEPAHRRADGAQHARSTRTSRWSAGRRRRWTASCAPRWMCWCWATSC